MYKRIAIHIIPIVGLFIIHYAAVHIYATLCVPLSVAGFIQTLLIMGSPMCNFLLSIMMQSNTIYLAFLVATGSLIASVFYGLYRPRTIPA